MMWSPGLTFVTPGPTSSTMPAASWPSTIGSGGVQSPFMMCQSLWQMPAAFTFTRASPARGPFLDQIDHFERSIGLEEDGGFHGDLLLIPLPQGRGPGEG